LAAWIVLPVATSSTLFCADEGRARLPVRPTQGGDARQTSAPAPSHRVDAGSGPLPLNSIRSDLSSINYRRSCLSCCWNKGVERPARRRYVGLVAVGVQEQAEDILVPPLLRNCLTLNDISYSQSYSPLRSSGPCNSFYCLG